MTFGTPSAVAAASRSGAAAPVPVTEVLGRLVRDWDTHFPEQTVPPTVEALTFVPRRLSDLALVELRFGESRLAVYIKAHKNPGAPLERVRSKAKLEFETLRALREGFRDVPACAVVRPIAFFAEEMAVVTEATPGENLHHLIKTDARAPVRQSRLAPLAGHCRATGVWLRRFQDITAQPRRETARVAQTRESVREDLAACVRMGLPRPAADSLLSFCESRLRTLEGQELAVVGVHPDFQPDNVLVSPHGATVLDFTSFQHGSPYPDAARFLASVDFFRRNPLYGRHIYALMTAFWEGYGHGDGTHPALVTHIVRHMVRNTRAAAAWRHPFPLNRLLERRAVAFLARWEQRLEAIQRTLAAASPPGVPARAREGVPG